MPCFESNVDKRRDSEEEELPADYVEEKDIELGYRVYELIDTLLSIGVSFTEALSMDSLTGLRLAKAHITNQRRANKH
ncbi:hypothetical protein WC27P1_00015 [Weissella phage WC27P1]|nr:hypothetical protein WC27P1_00015 [Weissella phage WC27P1]